MGWTPEQYDELMAKQTTKALLKPMAPVAAARPAPALDTRSTRRIVFHGQPIGKPRMTQRDKWVKRPCVVAYRQFADKLRLAAGADLPPDPDGLRAVAYIAMPPSWSKKKQERFNGQPHRTKPDYDNILKAIGDVLFANDAVIWTASFTKLWCFEGQQRLEIELEYQKL